MSIKWPSLSDEQIERYASDFREEALQALKLKQSIEVPVEQIAEIYLGYELDFVDGIEGYPEDVIGGIDFEAKVILVNSSIESHLGRYSFTIAHEIGHHVLHREEFYRHSKPEGIMCRGVKKRPIEEVQADRFAEALLMPAELVKDHYSKVKNRSIFKPINLVTLASLVIKSSGLKNVSVSAMVVRLNHLGLGSGIFSKLRVYNFLKKILRQKPRT